MVKNITINFTPNEDGYNLVDKWKGLVKSMGLTYKKRLIQIMEKDLNNKKPNNKNAS